MATITSLKFNIDSDWDGAGVKAARGDLKLLSEEMRRIQNTRLRVNVDVDDSSARAKLNRLEDDMRSRKTTVNVEADTAVAEAEIARTTRDREVDVHVNLRDGLAQLMLARAALAALGMAAAASTAAIALIGPAAAVAGAAIIASLPVAMIAAGAIILRKNEEIQASFERLKTQGMESLTRAAMPMKDSLVAGLNDILFHVKQLEPAFKRAFAAASTAVAPLIDSMMHMVENTMPGFNLALESMGPVMAGVQRGSENFGTSMSGMFAGLAQGAQGFGAAADIAFTQLGILMANFGVAAGQMATSGSMLFGGLLSGLNELVNGFLQGMKPALDSMAQPLADLLHGLGTELGEALRTILPSLGKLIASLAEALLPILQKLIPPLSEVIAAFADSLVPVVDALAPVLIALADGFGTMLRWLKPIMPVLGPLAVGFWALNAAMAANPIVLIVAGIAALAAGIVYLATRTQFFQNLWNTVWTAVKAVAQAVWTWMQRVWDDFTHSMVTVWQTVSGFLRAIWEGQWKAIRAVAEAIWNGIKAAWESLINGIRDFWNRVGEVLRASWDALWNTIKNVAQFIWDQIRNNWQTIVNAIMSAWNFFKDALRASWDALWNTIKDVAQFIWDQIRNNWQTIVNTVRAIYDGFANALRAAWDAFWNAIKQAAQFVWDTIKNNWQTIVNTVRSIYDNFADGLKSAWEGMWNTVKQVAQNVWDGIRNGFSEFKDGVVGTIEGLVNKVKEVWDRITGIFKAPVDTVKGIWNTVAEPFGLPKFAEGGAVQAYADGGGVRGPGTRTSDSIPARLSDGEHVWTAREVEAAGGHDNVVRMRRNVLDGQGFAGGGAVEWMWARVKEMQPSMSLTSSYRDSADYHGQGKAVDVSNGTDSTPQMRALTQQIHDAWGRDTLELIHNPSQFNIKNGRNVGDGYGLYGAGTMGGHRNHVHWAVPHPLDGRPGAAVGGGAGGGFSGPSPEQIRMADEAIAKIKKVIDDTNATSATRFGPVTSASNANIAEEIQRRKNMYGVFEPAGDVHAAGTDKSGVGAIAKIREKLSSLGGGAVGGTIPTGERLAIINAALDATRTPPPNSKESWQAGMNTLITRESNWNPNAVNNSDSNAAAGTPSKGLAQVIDPTFRAHHQAGTSDNIFDPIANVAASINYIRSRYGDISNVQQANANMPPKGYAAGTNSAAAGWHMVGEQGPEMVRFRGGEQVKSFNEIIAALKQAAEGSGNQLATKLTAELKASIDRLIQDGRNNSAAMEDVIERLLAQAGINIPISVSGGNAQQVVEQLKAQLLPQLEMMLRQGVGTHS